MFHSYRLTSLQKAGEGEKMAQPTTARAALAKQIKQIKQIKQSVKLLANER